MVRGQQKALSTLTASTPYTCYGAKWVSLNIHQSRATDRKFLTSHTSLWMDHLLSGYSKTQILETKLTNWTCSSNIPMASCLVLNLFRSSMLPTTHLWVFLPGALGCINYNPKTAGQFSGGEIPQQQSVNLRKANWFNSYSSIIC